MKNFIQYKGYTGTVEFTEEDACLFGKVIGIKHSISYEGASIPELMEDFRAAVDDYLDFCTEEGVSPEKPYKGAFNVRINPETHREAAMCAAQKGVTLNSFVSDAIMHAIQDFANQPQLRA